ncbi:MULTISPECIES: NADPH-dependent FMN reductase [unclassified Nocardia]|uniref:NADPH-dependent FMN reductase n=1 Tax=unclassified Nocardia TaxID=2637762 RepID=UPI001CE411DC|nr:MULTISPECIES: NAD(P)H-dependent oxidoreductase [unclassified Nocardia]
MRLAIVIGSVREGRFGPTVAAWFANQAKRHGDSELDIIDLAEVTLGSAGPSASPPAEVASALGELTPRLAAADAFVVVTPEYNHSYPAALKNAIDWHGPQFHAKPVAFVSYGGLSGGLRAVEHLRLVFAELHAVTIRDTVSFHGAWQQFDERGGLRDPAAAEAAAEKLLDQLDWWALALRDAKAERPYVA